MSASSTLRQLDAVAARLLARLAAATPILVTPILGGADQVAFLDLDDTVRQTYGFAKQGSSSQAPLTRMITSGGSPWG
jgi:hypothetical protein